MYSPIDCVVSTYCRKSERERERENPLSALSRRSRLRVNKVKAILTRERKKGNKKVERVTRRKTHFFGQSDDDDNRDEGKRRLARYSLCIHKTAVVIMFV